MSEQVNNPSFEEMLESSLTSLTTGKIVKGTVVRVTPTEVIVDLGYKSDGIITRSEFSDDASVDLTQLVKAGDEFDVSVLRVNDGEGNVVVSKKRVDSQVNLKHIEQACVDKTPVRGKVTEIVKNKEGTTASGLIANVLGNRVFIPASLVSNRFEKNLDEYKGKEFDLHIIECDLSKRQKRIVGSRKELAVTEAKQRREELLARLEEGQRVEGVVSRIADFGAFVDLGGVDGLIHVSEVSWKRVRKIADVLNVGDKVVAEVIKISPEKGKVSLSLKDKMADPWNGILDRYPIGSIVEGTVVRLASFGVFVSLEDGIDGLVHISQIANKHINKPGDEVSVGQVIQVKVIGVDTETHKISLSKRDADNEENELNNSNAEISANDDSNNTTENSSDNSAEFANSVDNPESISSNEINAQDEVDVPSVENAPETTDNNDSN